MCGTRGMGPLRAFSIASVSAFLLPTMPECVRMLVL